MLHPFCHIEIPTTDLERAMDFYSKLFGWKVELMPEQGYATFESGTPLGGGFRKVDKVDPGGPGSPLNYVLVENIEATIDKAQELGAGQVITGKTAVGEMGWFAIFTDPDGNRVAIWQNKQVLHSFYHIEIPTTDLERAMDFYSKLFGWKVELLPGQDYATFESGTPPGGGFQKVDKVDPGGPGSPLNYVLVENIEATIDKAQELGAGQVIMGKTAVGDMGWFAIFTDPDGNGVAIWQEK